MAEPKKHDPLLEPVSTIARQDASILRAESTVRQALDGIRSEGVGGRIVYFYVADGDDRLVGVVPTRRLLTASLEQRISEIMIRRIVTIQESNTILDAHKILVQNKFLALPIVNDQGQLRGVVDIGMFTPENLDALDRGKIEEAFELIGLRVSQMRNASPLAIFRFRFPWLLSTIAGGTICAILASAFDTTLAKSLVLAFFLTLVLGLGESVSMQSMTVTIHRLRLLRPTLKWYAKALRRELGTAFLLGSGCALIVGLIVWLWRGTGLAAVAIGSSILLVILVSACWGLTIPALLHVLKLDPKIAAGPVTLALADIGTILIYLSFAMMLL